MSLVNLRRIVAQLQEEAATVLRAKGPRKVVEYTSEEANKYRADRGRCPVGWHYNRSRKVCQPKRPKAVVPEKAPVIATVSEITNKLLEGLHKESLPATEIPAPMHVRDVKEFRERTDPVSKQWFDALSREEQDSIKDYMGAASEFPLESEVLLDEGSELKIVKAEMKDGVLHLSAEYRGP